MTGQGRRDPADRVREQKKLAGVIHREDTVDPENSENAHTYKGY